VPHAASLLGEIVRAFEATGVDLGALGLAWARAAPAVALVPAFGLRALPAPARAAIGLGLAACVFPALAPQAHDARAPWVLLLLWQMARGLPIAIAAAVPLWAATMAGGAIDALRGAQNDTSSPVVDGKATPLGAPLAILASAIFLATGGPARVASALAASAMPEHPLVAAAQDLVLGVALAVAVAGPLLAAAIVLEVAAALVARAASPAQIHTLLAPLRALGILAILGIVLDRAMGILAAAMR
jgi:type III secretory pathway component EscT